MYRDTYVKLTYTVVYEVADAVEAATAEEAQQKTEEAWLARLSKSRDWLPPALGEEMLGGHIERFQVRGRAPIQLKAERTRGPSLRYSRNCASSRRPSRCCARRWLRTTLPCSNPPRPGGDPAGATEKGYLDDGRLSATTQGDDSGRGHG
jgi:hypothetical protein